MSEADRPRTLRERLGKAVREADPPIRHREIARRMFAIERVEPTEKQIKDRSRQIARWRNTIPRGNRWGIGERNARLLALALGVPDDLFIADRDILRSRQDEELATIRAELASLRDEVAELRRRAS